MAERNPKQDPARVGVKVNLREPLYRWMRHLELREEFSSKTVIATAGLQALRKLNRAERDYLAGWAKLIDEGSATWQEYEAICAADEKTRKETLDRLIKRALERKPEEHRAPPVE